jgi:hypothetical protein
MFGVFILLAGFTWYFQRNEAGKTVDATPTPTADLVNLYDFDSSQVNEVQIVDGTSNQIVVFQNPATSQWVVKDFPPEQANSFQIESVLAQLFAIRSTVILTESVSLDAVGLKEPIYTITIRMKDGNEIITHVGSTTAIGSGYYVRIGDEVVNIVDKATLDEVLNLLSNPPLMATATPEGSQPTENEPAATPTQ